MAKYGVTIYGTDLYGNASTNNATYQVTLTAMPNGYDSILVDWGNLVEGIDDPPGTHPRVTHWRLVRSAAGVPDHPDLGENVLSGEFREGGVSSGVVVGWPGEFLDDHGNAVMAGINPLTSFVGNTQVSYSLWVYDGVYWRLVGSAEAVIVRQTQDTLSNMLRMIPGAWTSPGTIGFALNDPETDTDLAKYLTPFAFYYDTLRAKADLIASYSDPKYAPAQIVRRTIQDLGFSDEAALGDYYTRSIYRVGNFVNAYKGTLLGVRSYVTALTHWGNSIATGNNLLFEYDTSSFESSTGEWVPTSGTTITAKKYSSYTTTSNDLSRVVTSPISSLVLQRADGYTVHDTGFGVMQLSGGSGTLQLGGAYQTGSTYNNVPSQTNLGIPVTPGTYTFSGYFRRVTTASATTNIKLNVKYYDMHGNLIKSTTGTDTAVAEGAWVLVSTTTAEVLATENISRAVLEIVASSTDTSTLKFAIDFLSFAKAETALRFEDARTVKINLYGERENLFPNPGFDTTCGGWTVYRNGVKDTAQVTATPDIPPYFGTNTGRIVANTTNPLSIVSDWIPVLPDRALTFSTRLYTSAEAVRRAQVTLEFSCPKLESDQEKIVNGVFTGINHSETSDYFLIGFDDIITLTAQTPEMSKYGAAPHVKVHIDFIDSANADMYYIDSSLLEHTGKVVDFFQGNGAPAPSDPNANLTIYSSDCAWEQGVVANYILNPSVETDASNWTGVSRVTTDHLYGSAAAQLSATSVVISGAIGSDVPIGSDIVGSVYVKGAGEWSISLTGSGIQAGASVCTYDVTDTGWTRISALGIKAGNTVNITVTRASVDGLIDGAQLETGTIPTTFVGPGGDVYTLSGTTYYRNGSLNARRSFYWTKFADKVARLNASLNEVLPIGSSWELVYGNPSEDADGVSIPNGFHDSFEFSLKGWSTSGTGSPALTRTVSEGGTADPTVEGTAYATLTSTGASTPVAVSDMVPVIPNQTYHLCVAVRGKVGDQITLTAEKYLTAADATPTSVSTSVTPTSATDWYYLDIVTGDKSLFTTGSATFIKIKVSTTAAAGADLDIDRVVLRTV